MAATTLGGLLLLAASCGPAEDAVPGRSTFESGSAPSGGVAVFEGARLIVGDGTTVEDGALVVEGDRIARVGRSGEVEAPAGAARVDLAGTTVIPALIDAHVHLGYEDYTDWEGENYGRENVVEQLHRHAYYGVGTVFSAGTDPNDFAVGLQADQRAGRVGGARFLFAAGMAPPGQGPNRRLLAELADVDEAGGEPIVRGAATPEEGRRHVREIAEMGIRFVKLWIDDRGGTQEKLRPEVYRAVADEARRHGVGVVVHHQTLEDMKETARAGVDGYLHGRFGPRYDEDGELIRLLRESGAYVIPNLGISELRGPRVYDDPFFRETVRPGLVERLRERFPAEEGTDPYLRPPERRREIRDALTRFQEAGVPIVLGTDAGGVPNHYFGFAAHAELEIYVRSGLTPMQALVAGTGAAAEALGLEDTGTLDAGKSADFVVLDADPLDDVRNTRRIRSVYLGGREVDREALRAGWTGADASVR